MTNVEKLIGKEVIFTGEAKPRQGSIFTVGKRYKVSGLGECPLGKGIKVNDTSYVIVHGNYKVVRPEPLTLNEFLKALYNNETVVSVDVDDDEAVYDRYSNFYDLQDLLSWYEAETYTFYREDVWEEYESLKKLAEELPIKRRKVPFAEALKHLADGKTVEVYVNGEKQDEYKTPNDLHRISDFEIEDGGWYVIE